MSINARINNKSVVFETIEDLVARLGEEPSVTSVYLGYSNIGPAGVTALAEALKANRTVTSVDLRGNYIGPAGATALAEVLKVNGVVTSVYLACNDIGPAGAIALAEALQTNTTVTRLSLDYSPAFYEIVSTIDYLLTPEGIAERRVLSAQSKIADCIKDDDHEKYDANKLAVIIAARSTSSGYPNIEKLEDLLRASSTKSLRNLALLTVLGNADYQVAERGASSVIESIGEAISTDFKSEFASQVIAELSDKYKGQIAEEVGVAEREKAEGEEADVAMDDGASKPSGAVSGEGRRRADQIVDGVDGVSRK